MPLAEGVLYALAGSTLFIGVRAVAMLLAARAVGVRAHFRMTEPLLWLALPIGLSGGLVPVPGGVYLSDPDWRMREAKDKLGLDMHR